MKLPMSRLCNRSCALRLLFSAGLLAAASGVAAVEMFVESAGVGIGTSTPQRMLHLAGPTALFRMDRTSDTAAFLIVRTTPNGAPMKAFVVGTNASGDNVGEFVINDLGAAVGGAGQRRMTIANNGNVTFTGSVVASTFSSSSTARLKRDIVSIDHAVDLVKSMRGVKFNWKSTGIPSIGVVAEEVNKVLPEVVERDSQSKQPTAVNYSALVGVLIEAIKEQQNTIEQQGVAINQLKQRVGAVEAAN